MPTVRRVVVNEPRLKVENARGGWSHVTYTDPNANKPIEFNIRTSKIADVMNREANAWFHPAEAVYSEWINSSVSGQKYSARRQVEGMLKVAIKKGDIEMVDKLTAILKMNDDKVAQFRQMWLDAHTDMEIEDFYDYDEDDELIL